jgi:hypothetical protein
LFPNKKEHDLIQIYPEVLGLLCATFPRYFYLEIICLFNN